MPLLCVISLNGRWTADPERNSPAAISAARAMTRCARLYAEHLAEREAIRPAPAARLTEFAEQLRWRVRAVDGQKPGKCL